MRLARVIFAIVLLFATVPAFANPEKVPNEDTGYALDRVECDLSGMDFYDMVVGDTFDNTGGPITYGPLPAPGSGFLSKVVLSIDIDQTWIGDLVIDLYYDHDGNGTYDAGPVSALCRPNLDGCAYDGCCGCSMDVLGIYTFGDDGAAPMGDPDCPGGSVPNGCFQPAPESPFSFAGAFNGLPAGGNFYLEIADGAGADETTLFGWGVYVAGAPTELTVKPDGTGDVPNIQDAVLEIAEGGTIYLTDGIFQGPGNWNVITAGKAFELRSQSLNPETCIMDGNAIFSRSLDSAGGAPSGIPVLNPDDRDNDDWGLLITAGETSSTIIRGITFQNFATTWYGSAVYVYGSSPTFEDCRFLNCYSDVAGGAVFLEECTAATFTNCEFTGNMSPYGGSVVVWKGPGNASFEGCTFRGNIALWGGAFYVEDGASPEVTNSLFYANNADFGGAFMAFDNASGLPDVRYSTLSENSATEGGNVWSSHPVRFWFDIIAFANDGAAFAWYGGGQPDIACTDIFGNVEGDWVGPLAGMESSDGNLHADPEFCGNLGTWDFRLQEDSPCALGNNGCASNIGAFGAECGTSSSAITNWGEVKSLY